MTGHGVLALPGGAELEIPAGACVAVVGADASARVGAWGDARGAGIMVPDALDPLLAGWSVADQLAAVVGGTRRAALDRAVDLLELTGVPEPHRRVRARPHQLAPVDRQRIQLALLLAGDLELITAEDPAAGLAPADAAALLATLRRLWVTRGFTLLLGTAELQAAERVAEEIVILAEDGVSERRRRVPAAGSSEAQASSSSSSSSST